MVGAVVKRRRLALGLTQVELGRRTGLSQNYISKLEKGEVDLPQRGTLDTLGGALGLPVEDFYRAAGVLNDLPAETAKPLPDPADLPPALVDAMRQMIQDHPELAPQFARHAQDEDFGAQVRELALALGYVVRGWIKDD